MCQIDRSTHLYMSMLKDLILKWKIVQNPSTGCATLAIDLCGAILLQRVRIMSLSSVSSGGVIHLVGISDTVGGLIRPSLAVTRLDRSRSLEDGKNEGRVDGERGR